MTTRPAGRPAAGGGRWVHVAPERVDAWLRGFLAGHGAVTWTAAPAEVVVTAADGARAECTVPFPPLSNLPEAEFGGLVAHALAERTVGVLLVRLGGFAVGVFEGPRLVTSKAGSRPVHGRSAAGGWSQHRFARRREGQVRVALDAAAAAAAAVLVPALDRLQGVVVGGDRQAIATVLQDGRLAGVRERVTGEPLDVPDPGRRVLEAAYPLLRAVRIRVVDPG